MRVKATLAIGAVVVAILAATLVTVTLVLNRDDDSVAGEDARAIGASDAAAQVARGEYLVRAGNCRGCHSETGGEPFAGGEGIATPFGVVQAPNLTPDAQGLGAWSADDFWRALHNGRSRDRRLLYPAFPYPNYTRLLRADADAMYSYLRTVPPVARANKAHTLRFPFDQQAALAVWRALFFRPARFETDGARSPQWNRGAYLVETLGHCNACHSQRNVFGASVSTLDLAGGLIPIQNWYAPSLFDDAEAGVGDWPAQDVVALLKTGVSARGSAQGPMARVVVGSTQYLNTGDLAAMAAYLRELPGHRPAVAATTTSATAMAGVSERGRRLYSDHCAACHGDAAEGIAGAYPALAGNRAIALEPPANLIHMVLRGGFAPETIGHPRPFGMPPFATTLSDDEVADVLSYVRAAWQPRAAPVSALEVRRFRGAAR
jgi:mono/diheme cytochrome c family protein